VQQQELKSGMPQLIS